MCIHSRTCALKSVHGPFLSVYSVLEIGSVGHHKGRSTHSEELNGTNIIYRTIAPCHWSLNIVNSCVKVSVVVINKHTQRDLLFDKRSRSKCHLTERFWELSWSSMFVSMETNKQCSSLSESKGGSAGRARAVEDRAVLCTMNSTVQHLISSCFLPFCLLCIYSNVFSVLPCLLFGLSARRTVIFDTAQLWHYNQHFLSNSFAHKNVNEKQIELPRWLESQHFGTHMWEQA